MCPAHRGNASDQGKAKLIEINYHPEAVDDLERSIIFMTVVSLVLDRVLLRSMNGPSYKLGRTRQPGKKIIEAGVESD